MKEDQINPEDIQKLMAETDAKEIAQMCSIHGYIIGLASILLKIGVLKPEDIVEWEELTLSASAALAAVSSWEVAKEVGVDLEKEDEITLTKNAMEGKVYISHLLCDTKEKAQKAIQQHIDRLKELGVDVELVENK